MEEQPVPGEPPVDPALLQRIGHDERDQVAEALRDAAAAGRLTMDELDERLEAAFAARTYADIAPLTADLPGATGPRLPATRASVPTPAAADAGLPAPHRVTRPAHAVPPLRAIGVLSGAERDGPWTVPETVTAIAFWGGVSLDLRDAVFTAPSTEITAVAVMGGIEIVVPDDVVVQVDGLGIMGGFARPDQRRFRTDLAPDAPRLRIKGLAVWGGVSVRVKPPGSRRVRGRSGSASPHSLHKSRPPE